MRPGRVFLPIVVVFLCVGSILIDVPPAGATPFSVSGETIIYLNAELGLLGLDGWPDGEMGVEPLPGTYAFHAPQGPRQSRTTGSLDDPGLGSVSGPFSINGVPPEYGYAAGGPIYKDPASGMLVMFTHLERWRGGNAADFYSTIGLSKSVDGGLTWSFLGEVFRHATPVEQCPGTVSDAASGTYSIRNDGGTDFFYMYVHDWQTCSQFNSLAVLRAPISDVVSAATSGGVSAWVKYHNGSWIEPGIGGLSSELWPDALPWKSFGSVSWNTYLQKYVMVLARPHWGFLGIVSWWLELIESSDGLTWSAPQVVAQSPLWELVYPTIVSFGANPRVSGQSFYVYYVWSTSPGANRWNNADLRRRTISFA